MSDVTTFAGDTSSAPLSPVLRVTDAQSLKAALMAASGGETIVLADGDYGTLSLKSQFNSTVTLLAENAQGARVTGLALQDCQNLTLDGIFFDYVASPGASNTQGVFTVQNSAGVTLRNSLFDGDNMDDPTDAGNGYPTGRGLRVTGSDNIVVENNEFRTFWKAMNLSSNTNLVVRGNDIHDIRSDGINTTRSDGVLIEGNHIHDFRGNIATGDHADMIQMYSATDGILPRNITIRDNFLDIGDGSVAQAIFINHNKATRDLYGDALAFENITITGNVIVGGQVHGITLGTTHGAVVSNNTLITPPGSGMSAPRIEIDVNSTGVVLTDNMAQGIQNVTTPPDGWSVAGNILLQQDSAYLPNHYSNVFINVTGGTSNLENLQILPGSVADLSGAGSPLLRYDPTPDSLTALVRPETGDLVNEILFDASFSAGPDGAAADSGAQFFWDFGDGQTGIGVNPLHRYTAPGTYTATLTVTLPDGETDSTEIVSAIWGPDLLSFNAQSGLLELTMAESTTVIALSQSPHAALDFNDTTMIWLPDDISDRLQGADSLTVTLRVRADDDGKLFGCKTVIGASIETNGDLKVSLAGSNTVFAGANLLDGAWHDVRIAFDGPGGNLTLAVDGVAQTSAVAVFALPAAITESLKIGAVQGDGSGFTGSLAALDIDVNPQRYDMTPLAPSLPLPLPEPEVTGQMEVGTITVAQDHRSTWHHVSFDTEITDARVVMGPVSSNGNAQAFARVSNVTDTGFDFQIDEWDYADGRHATETVSWLAASAGTHVLASGQRIVVGRIDAHDDIPVPVSLDGFSGGTVLAQVSSANGPDAVVTRVSGVAADGFDLHMQEQESSDGSHVAETVDWIALESHVDGFQFQELQLTDQRQEIGSADGLALLGGMQTETGTDPASLRYHSDKDGTISLRIEEETSQDQEMQHLAEDTHILLLAAGSYDLYL